MSNLNPSQGLRLVDARRERLRQAMTRTSSLSLHPDIRDLYLDLFANSLEEALHIPGFGIAQEMLLERLCWLWASMKSLDNGDEPTPALEYAPLVKEFLKASQVLLQARKTSDAEEQFKLAFAQTVLRAAAVALEASLSEQDAARVHQRMVEELRGALTAVEAPRDR